MTMRLTVQYLDHLTRVDLTKVDPLTKVWPGCLRLVAIAAKLRGTGDGTVRCKYDA